VASSKRPSDTEIASAIREVRRTVLDALSGGAGTAALASRHFHLHSFKLLVGGERA